MSKLRAIAEMLRSDNKNERETAVKKIEEKTGLSITTIIKTGISFTMIDKSEIDIIMNSKTDDDMIVAVNSLIQQSTSNWASIVENGDRIANRKTIFTGEQEEPGIIRVYPSNLPAHATGVPKITKKGTDRLGAEYAIVTFDRMRSSNGSIIKPACKFVAFGDFSKRVCEMAHDNETVSVSFKRPKFNQQMVQIVDAL